MKSMKFKPIMKLSLLIVYLGVGAAVLIERRNGVIDAKTSTLIIGAATIAAPLLLLLTAYVAQRLSSRKGLD